MATMPGLGEVAQLVEHTTENRGVASSILALAISRLRRIAASFLSERELRRADAEEYAGYIRDTGFTEYARTAGNRGAWMLLRDGREP